MKLPPQVLQKSLAMCFPVNTLRLAAASKAALKVASKAAEWFKEHLQLKREDWVIIGEGAEFDGRLGQLIRIDPWNRQRCQVQVDGRKAAWIWFSLSRDPPCVRVESLPRLNL